MSGLAIKWWMTILGFFSFICVTDWWTSEGYLRKDKKVVLKSNVVKRVFGFSEWVTEVDRSSIILNIKNEIVLIFLIVGWFVIDADKKECFIDKLYMRGIFIAIMIVEGLIWPMIIEWQMGKEEKPAVYMRETFDLCEQEGEITSYDDERCIYKYVYTYSKKEDMPNKVVIFPPHAYSELMDVDGNGYTWNSKGEYKMLTNKGAYQELSDALVRAGYITLRLEAKRQLGLYKANAKMLSELFLRILEQQSFQGSIFLFAHGYVNDNLLPYRETMRLQGIISMCGAGIGFKEVEIRRIMWTGKSEKKAQKIFEKRKAKILKERPEFNNCREIDTSREEWIEKFFEGTAGIPVFAGYVEQDPFYSPEIAEEIKKRNAENVEVVKFERTDFTFRKCNVNKRIHELGYMVDDKKKIPPMNPEVAEKIIEWLEEDNERISLKQESRGQPQKKSIANKPPI